MRRSKTDFFLRAESLFNARTHWVFTDMEVADERGYAKDLLVDPLIRFVDRTRHRREPRPQIVRTRYLDDDSDGGPEQLLPELWIRSLFA